MNARDELIMLKIEVGDRIRTARLESGFTQVELAERAALNRSSIIAIEKGRNSSRFPTLLKVALALDLPLSELFSDIEQCIEDTGIARL